MRSSVHFKNEPLTDFSIAANRTLFESALQLQEERLAKGPLEVFPIINGEFLRGSAHTVKSVNPSLPSQSIGTIHYASVAEVENALRSLAECAHRWEEVPATIRASYLRRAGDIMRERKSDLAALIILEAGKPWREADADVAEAIDFCRYYADHMELLATPLPTSSIPGEENFYFYQPRGVSVVIAPWNFPLAIPCGMTVAALVTGNPTILKPAEQTSVIAFEFAKILLEAGIPPYAFAFLPGQGEVIGPPMVNDSRTALICFTGSKAVGLSILKDAASVNEQQQHVKRVIAEMGGKNAIIVDDDADLDEAVKGVLTSAFGYAGQKCSACSRCIVVGDAYEPFLARLRDALADLPVGNAREPQTLVGPVIDSEAKDRIERTIREGKKTLTTLASREVSEVQGFLVPPTIFKDVPHSHPIWQEEIFGPVLACTQANSFEDALRIANESRYALTGGVFSRSPSHLAHARRGFKVGNLYINSGITGALVGRQPFGGFKLSGVGSKAGGPDYLLQFLEPRTVTENTMRRGFAPEMG